VVLFASVFALELECSRSYSDLVVSAHCVVFVGALNPHQRTSSFQLAQRVLLLEAQ
jgi:hypothetical protein